MMERPQSRSSMHLEIPRKSVELHDPGAKELDSSEGEEEYFSDASEGRRKISRPATPASPIPRTRVEKVDDLPSHGQIPGSEAYEKRLQDAVPDEIEVIPEGRLSKRNSQNFSEPAASPNQSNVPRMVVEKVDPSEPAYGDIPGTDAWEKRRADATPDIILKAAPGRSPLDTNVLTHQRNISDTPIPETIVTPVDDGIDGAEDSSNHPTYGWSNSGPSERVEEGSPTLDRFVSHSNYKRRKSSAIFVEASNEDYDEDIGEDFDDFEEGAQAGIDDDFGDFDDGFPEPATDVASSPAEVQSKEQEVSYPSYPLLDLDVLSSLPDLLEAAKIHLDIMFPTTNTENLFAMPEPESLPIDSPIFPSERSRSLWKQLITPPPLQPPNWTKSRIRRLFLVSLGVPVDLDEILPPSKQKKLVLPDINLESSGRRSESDRALGSVERLKARAANTSTGSIDSNQSGTKPGRRRRRGPPPPPELDLNAVKRLCATTDEKMDGFTDEELENHVSELQRWTEKTSQLLEYWLKRRDGALKEKEAFEGVIENLVKHARRVRK